MSSAVGSPSRCFVGEQLPTRDRRVVVGVPSDMLVDRVLGRADGQLLEYVVAGALGGQERQRRDQAQRCPHCG